MNYAIKAEIPEPRSKIYVFSGQKTMYGGKHVAVGDTVYIFASENEGGAGLVAKGHVSSARALPKDPSLARQTPRVSLTILQTALAKLPLGRAQLKPFRDWRDGQPQTEMNFKFYRQATNKLVGISPEAAAFLDGHF